MIVKNFPNFAKKQYESILPIKAGSETEDDYVNGINLGYFGRIDMWNFDEYSHAFSELKDNILDWNTARTEQIKNIEHLWLLYDKMESLDFNLARRLEVNNMKMRDSDESAEAKSLLHGIKEKLSFLTDFTRMLGSRLDTAYIAQELLTKENCQDASLLRDQEDLSKMSLKEIYMLNKNIAERWEENVEWRKLHNRVRGTGRHIAYVEGWQLYINKDIKAY